MENRGSDPATWTIVLSDCALETAAAGPATAATTQSTNSMRFIWDSSGGGVGPEYGAGCVRPEYAPARPAAGTAARPVRRAQFRARLRSGANSAHGSVLATSAAVSQARRAVATPQRVFGSVFGPVGVGVDEDPTPARPRRARGGR